MTLLFTYLYTVVSVCSGDLCLPPSMASGCSGVAAFLKGVVIIDNVDDLSQGCLVKSIRIQKCTIILLGPAVKTRTKGSFINREEDKQGKHSMLRPEYYPKKKSSRLLFHVSIYIE